MSYLLTFYVPESQLESVKSALFAVGAGKLGEYDQVCWQTLGQGQFRPLAAANPTIGSKNELTRIEEYKVEMVCSDKIIASAIYALKEAHPYEEPAYSVITHQDF